MIYLMILALVSFILFFLLHLLTLTRSVRLCACVCIAESIKHLGMHKGQPTGELQQVNQQCS